MTSNTEQKVCHECLRVMSQRECYQRGYAAGQRDSQRQPEWVSVEDRLPEVSEPVQAYTDKGTLFPRAWLAPFKNGSGWAYMNVPDGTGWNWLDSNSGHNERVTHWQPLPPPPQHED